jgi:DNA-binding CsgD family transcriptional regulator
MPRGPSINITKEEFEELYINQKLSCKLISIKLNCTESNISRIRIGYGIERVYNSEIHLDEEKLKRLVKEGWSQSMLAVEFKTSTTTIKNKMKKLGIKSCAKSGIKADGDKPKWDVELVNDTINEPKMADIKRIVKGKYKFGSKLKGSKIIKFYENFVQTEHLDGTLEGFTYADVWRGDIKE